MAPLLHKLRVNPQFFDLSLSAWRQVLWATKNDPKNLSINFLHIIHNWWTLKLCRIHFGRTKICYVYNRKRENALLLIINLKIFIFSNIFSVISYFPNLLKLKMGEGCSSQNFFKVQKLLDFMTATI